jgi:hypothetical protein
MPQVPKEEKGSSTVDELLVRSRTLPADPHPFSSVLDMLALRLDLPGNARNGYDRTWRVPRPARPLGRSAGPAAGCSAAGHGVKV